MLKFVWITLCTAVSTCATQMYDILYFNGKVQITHFPGFIDLLLVDHKLLILLVALASCFLGMVFQFSNATQTTFFLTNFIIVEVMNHGFSTLSPLLTFDHFNNYEIYCNKVEHQIME